MCKISLFEWFGLYFFPWVDFWKCWSPGIGLFLLFSKNVSGKFLETNTRLCRQTQKPQSSTIWDTLMLLGQEALKHFDSSTIRLFRGTMFICGPRALPLWVAAVQDIFTGNSKHGLLLSPWKGMRWLERSSEELAFPEGLLLTIFKTLYVHRLVANIRLSCGGSWASVTVEGRFPLVCRGSVVGRLLFSQAVQMPHIISEGSHLFIKRCFCWVLTCYSSFPIPVFPNQNKSAFIVSILPSFMCAKHVKTKARYLQRVILTMSLCLRES